MILKDSRPRIIANLITDNDGIGLFVRDKSNGVVQKNIVHTPPINYLLPL